MLVAFALLSSFGLSFVLVLYAFGLITLDYPLTMFLSILISFNTLVKFHAAVAEKSKMRQTNEVLVGHFGSRIESNFAVSSASVCPLAGVVVFVPPVFSHVGV